MYFPCKIRWENSNRNGFKYRHRKNYGEGFFQRGARVIMACRNMDKANDAVKDIKEECKGRENLGELIVTELDLSRLKSVKECANNLLNTEKRINILVNNAGVMMCPKTKTEDGYELQFATNHLGHFLLTLLLLPKICQSSPARIVNVSSMAHSGVKMDFLDLNWDVKKYSALGAYQQSKLANILFTKELARKLNENNIEGVNVYSLHPGVIKTELGRHIIINKIWGLRWLWENISTWFIKTPEQGAQTSIYCAVDEKCENETGLYYAECAVKEPSMEAQNEENSKKAMGNES
ncbi:hypothetical protein NQ318_002735 [Aromia moschata]|uniref:Retinol dehydrogenase 13 n=1 Tax=Aromia moschata TaxID=1265417 RepID=A0AAV8Y5G1_9CUCU|nr:hypothetical protein NQ318_002735 [Aromia moschata]